MNSEKEGRVLAPRLTCTLILAMVLAQLAGCREESTQLPSSVPSVLVQEVSPADSHQATVYPGEVRARHEADLAFRVGGRLASRLVDVGAVVRSGLLLAQLDPADLQLNVAAVRAQLSAAESEMVLARAEADRYASLAEQKFVSQAALDARLAAAKAATARVEQARAQLAVASNQASYGRLLGDRNGVVTAVLAEAGQVLAPGQPVLRVAQPGEKEVLIHVPEGRQAALKAADHLTVTLWAQPAVRLRGVLREMAPAAEPASRTYAARVRLLDDDPALQLGMTAQVALPSKVAGEGVQVPLAAVVNHGQAAQVWVVSQGRVQPRVVKVSSYRENDVILGGGVAIGEQVVVVGAHKLVAGQSVHPVALAARR